jgi:hypothetical protein
MLDDPRVILATRLLDDPEQSLNVLDILRKRWHNADMEGASAFDRGRREGYTQAISLLMGMSHAETHLALRAGEL